MIKCNVNNCYNFASVTLHLNNYTANHLCEVCFYHYKNGNQVIDEFIIQREREIMIKDSIEAWK